MEKSKLEKFVSKYNLGGSCESVLWKSDGTDITVNCISDDKNVLEIGRASCRERVCLYV